MLPLRTQIILLMLMLFSSNAFTADLGFRDIRIGMSRAAAWEDVQKYNTHFRPEDERGVIHFASDVKGSLVLVAASHYANRIELITFTFDRPDHERVFDALVEKYGKPSSIRSEKLQNGFGAKQKRRTAHWKLKEGHIDFWEFGSDVKTGSVMMSSLRWLALKSAQEESERASAGF